MLQLTVSPWITEASTSERWQFGALTNKVFTNIFYVESLFPTCLVWAVWLFEWTQLVFLDYAKNISSPKTTSQWRQRWARPVSKCAVRSYGSNGTISDSLAQSLQKLRSLKCLPATVVADFITFSVFISMQTFFITNEKCNCENIISTNTQSTWQQVRRHLLFVCLWALKRTVIYWALNRNEIWALNWANLYNFVISEILIFYKQGLHVQHKY